MVQVNGGGTGHSTGRLELALSQTEDGGERDRVGETGIERVEGETAGR